MSAPEGRQREIDHGHGAEANHLTESVEALRWARNELARLGPHSAERLHTLVAVADVLTGQSPRDAVWQQGAATLWRYRSAVPEMRAIPIVFVAGLINRPYLLDLYPGGSLIEFLVDHAYDVYLLDWGIPGPDDSGLTFDDYVGVSLRAAIAAALRASGADGYTLCGYWMGGTMVAAYAGLRDGDARAALRNLALFAAPVDFADDGGFAAWLRDHDFDFDAIIDQVGNVPGELLDLDARLLPSQAEFDASDSDAASGRPRDVDLAGRLAFTKWVNDRVPIPSAALWQWITEFCEENRLARGTLRIGGRSVDIDSIAYPVLVVAAADDELVPPREATALVDLVSSDDATSLVIPGGHADLWIGEARTTHLWPSVVAWLDARSNATTA